MKNAALFIVDVQNDFLPGGALAVPRGDEVIEPVNRLISSFDTVLASKDWHPPRTLHFDQWPVHCVRGTEGAAFPPGLNISRIQKIFLKGTGYADDGYSAFEATNEDLESYLRIRGIDRLVVTGLATDYCVKATAIAAARKGFEVYVVKEAVRAVNLQPDDEQKAFEEMQAAGVRIISENQIHRL
ncbi:MAG: nicotinamidase [Chlorobi bacterium]|nr:nicotinamidase [Chlorobiota bacterium]